MAGDFYCPHFERHNPSTGGVLISKAAFPDAYMLRSATVLVACLLLCATTYARHDEYAGRYTDGKDYAVYFEQTPYGLTIRPVIWTATQLLRREAKDKFVVVDRTSRGAQFRRSKDGRVIGVTIKGMDGEGLVLRRADGPLLPVELFLEGQTREAAAAYLARNETTTALVVAEQVLKRVPTKTPAVVSFLEQMAPRLDSNARFHSLLGYALVQAGDRKKALLSFRRAYQLEPKNEDTISGLARLNALPAKGVDKGWKLPFALSSVFEQPTSSEIRAVEKDWTGRNLAVRGVRTEYRGMVTIADHVFFVRILSHIVLGKRHYGVILIPKKAPPGPLPIIIEAKGVSPTYFALDLQSLSSPPMLGELANQFVYVIPTYRGEVLNFDGTTYTSEGDRTDALDGATDDALALLNVALVTTPGIDPTRICAFGRSRGGTVAMLAGIRDKRIRCVVNWAGPTDWFYLMGTNGWTEQELWGEALRTRATPLQTGGQNVERFLKRAMDGNATLADVRHRMIASSPLYFAHLLPQSQHHYGIEDPSVPVRNGRELVERLQERRVPESRYSAYFYPDQGHDTDRLLAPVHSREFIERALEDKEGIEQAASPRRRTTRPVQEKRSSRQQRGSSRRRAVRRETNMNTFR